MIRLQPLPPPAPSNDDAADGLALLVAVLHDGSQRVVTVEELTVWIADVVAELPDAGGAP